ncbi:MAG: AtpZ/AtpI family protein [Pseudomonadota bacterium]
MDAKTRDRRAKAAAQSSRGDYSGLGLAMRLGSEFVAGVIVGAGIGWGVDELFGFSPWGLIVFMFLGFIAGMMNMVRAGRAAEAARLEAEAADAALARAKTAATADDKNRRR